MKRRNQNDVEEQNPVSQEDHRIPRQPRAQVSRKRKRQVWITVGLSIVLLIALLIAAFFFYQEGLKPVSDSDEKIIVTIPSGASIGEISMIMDDNGLIRNPLVFTSYVGRYSNKEKPVMAADYQLSPSMSVPEIFDVITSGEAYHGDEYEIVVPEGRNIREIAKIAADTGLMSERDFIAEAGKLAHYRTLYPILSSIPENEVAERTLEGYLFPDTYQIYVMGDEGEETTASKLVNAMLTRFSEMYTDTMKTRTEESGRTVDEVVIMASIVELETKLPEDRKDAASVFYNRIAAQMPLQSDITVDYALGTKTPVLTTEQVESTDSPYNTYLNLGLPLGPICNPGLASIEAAISPNQTDFLYFVADMTTGKLHFNATYEGHEEDVATYMSDEAIQSVTQ